MIGRARHAAGYGVGGRSCVWYFWGKDRRSADGMRRAARVLSAGGDGNGEEWAGGSGDPEQCITDDRPHQGSQFGLARHGAAKPPLTQDRPEARVFEQPRFKALGRTGETCSGNDQERRSGKNRKECADKAEPDEKESDGCVDGASPGGDRLRIGRRLFHFDRPVRLSPCGIAGDDQTGGGTSYPGRLSSSGRPPWVIDVHTRFFFLQWDPGATRGGAKHHFLSAKM